MSVLGGGFTNGIAVDDVEFSDAGPPPVCNATSVPTIVLTEPAAAPAVQHNEFPLQGAVDTGGAPSRARSSSTTCKALSVRQHCFLH